MVTAMNYLSVLDIDSKHLESGIDSNHDRISTDDSNIPDVGKWAFHSKFIPEETTILHPGKEFPSYEKRKKYFCNAQIRENTLITPDHIYAMDFYDGYFDINTAQIKMPGFSLNALKYWDGTQKLRYSLTTRDRKIVFFCIQYEFVKRKDYEINDE